MAVDVQCIPLNETFGTGHKSDSKMFPETILPVRTLTDQTGQEIWCVILDALSSILRVFFFIEGMNAIPFIEINPKNSSVLKLLKEKVEALKSLSKKAIKRIPKKEKVQWKKQLSGISKIVPSTIPLEQKKKRLKTISGRFESRALRKGLSIGEKKAAKRLCREIMDIRRKIRWQGTFYEIVVGLPAIAHGTIEWLLVYSIRGQNEGINGIIKKRSAVIGD